MIKEQEIRESERKRIGEHLHDVIANELLYLQFLILKAENEINQESFSKIISELEFIRTQIRNLSHHITTPKPEHRISLSESIKEVLLDYIFLFPNITINYNVFPKKFSNVFDTSTQQEIIIVVKELIQNALQHGKPEVIEVGLTDFENEINIMIEDNGKGFQTESHYSGIGLTNCKSRVNKINGSFYIESYPNKGTTVNINIKK